MRNLPLVFLVAACGGVEEPEPDLAFKCPIAYCGSNSPTIDHYGFHELNLDGIANKQGFRILGASSGTDFVDLTVTDSRIAAFAPNKKIIGTALIGTRIYLAHSTGKQFAMEITNVTTVDEVVPPNDPVESYHFQWAAVVSNQLAGKVPAGAPLPLPGFDVKQDVCPVFVTDPGWHEWDDVGNPPPQAIVFEGDRIDPVLRTVQATVDRRWFNISCGNDTLVKMRLARSTMITTRGDWRLAQATLKMLSADYCGTGKSFTMRGEPLVWLNRAGMALRFPPTSFEARWDERGARCLDLPRAAATTNPYLAAEFPDIELAIRNECKRPPPCTSTTYTYQPGDNVISGNLDP